MGQVPRELTPLESALHFFGAELRHWRTVRELSQAALGQRTHDSGALIGKIEKGERFPSLMLTQRLDAVLDTGGVLERLWSRVEHERAAPSLANPTDNVTAAATRQQFACQLAAAHATAEAIHGGNIDRRHIVQAIGSGAVLCPLTGQVTGLRELVLNAAHSSAVIHSAIDIPKIEDRTLDEARQDLNRLATDYVGNSGFNHILAELVILRDRLYVLLARYGQRPGDARELNLLLGATCVLLASLSHDLGEPHAAMIQTRTALAFAEHAGHAALITWVYCTRASIASWSGSADDVLHHGQQARAVGLSGVGAIRLAGLEVRALAQGGHHQQVAEVLDAARAQRDKIPATGSLRDLGEVFTFSAARQHYYNAAACACMCDWEAVEREASRVIDLCGTPETGQCWPVTLTLSQIYLAQARLSLSGLEGAQDALIPVFAVPDEQRIPQMAQALSMIWVQLRSKIYANLPAARDLDEAIRNFSPVVGTQERQ
ncbi:MAG: helix-turn-helix domain-containing protein [Pseudonocardiaceae bacterium]